MGTSANSVVKMDTTTDTKSQNIGTSTNELKWGDTITSVDKYYELGARIGHGSFGQVYLATDLRTNAAVVIKKSSDKDCKFVKNEAAILLKLQQGICSDIPSQTPASNDRQGASDSKSNRWKKEGTRLSHSYIIKPLAYFQCESLQYLVLERMDIDLLTILHRQKEDITSDHHVFFMYQLLKAVAYLHKQNIVHRDIKSSNLLVNSDCTLKLCDFGYGAQMEKGGVPILGEIVTRWYRAPEIILGSKVYTPAADMWSVGCTFAEILSTKMSESGTTRTEPLFPGDDARDQILKIFKTLGSPHIDCISPNPHDCKNPMCWPDLVKLSYYNVVKGLDYSGQFLTYSFPRTVSDAAVNLLRKLLAYDPNKRLTAEEALKHPYFTEYR